MKRKPEVLIEDALEPVLLDGTWYSPRMGTFTLDLGEGQEDVGQKQAAV